MTAVNASIASPRMLLVEGGAVKRIAEVLAKFGLSRPVVAGLLARFDPAHQVPAGGAPSLPDPDDEVFLAAALATADRVLVTGNGVHFPARICRPVRVLSPVDAWRELERG